MKCPACEIDMECLPGNRYQHSAFYDKLHLHCLNSQCPARVECNYISHMCVLAREWPYSMVYGWSCHEYHLPFKVEGKWYFLIGQQEAFSGTIVRSADDPKPLMLVNFLYISADSDMHQQAWKVFMRLKNLLVFT